MGFGCLQRLKRVSWWCYATAFLWQFKKYLLKPSVMLALALTLPYVGLDVALGKIAGHGTVYGGPAEIIGTFGVGVIAMLIAYVAAFVLLTWGLLSSLRVLTAMCCSFLEPLPADDFCSDKLQLKEWIAGIQAGGINFFSNRKSYLATVWLMYSIFMIIPSTILFATLVVLMLGVPVPSGTTPMPVQINLPLPIVIASSIACGISAVIMTNYALVLMPVSARAQTSGTVVSRKGLSLSLKVLPAITIYSILTYVLSTLIAAPVDALVIAQPSLASDVVVRYILFGAKALWHLISFMFFVPFSLLIPCEMVRNHTD